MVIGYARVSTDDQTNAAQLAELKKAVAKGYTKRRSVAGMWTGLS
jgi:DNA invertase Pin-like site-specific DNA recombinase